MLLLLCFSSGGHIESNSTPHTLILQTTNRLSDLFRIAAGVVGHIVAVAVTGAENFKYVCVCAVFDCATESDNALCFGIVRIARPDFVQMSEAMLKALVAASAARSRSCPFALALRAFAC